MSLALSLGKCQSLSLALSLGKCQGLSPALSPGNCQGIQMRRCKAPRPLPTHCALCQRPQCLQQCNRPCQECFAANSPLSFVGRALMF